MNFLFFHDWKEFDHVIDKRDIHIRANYKPDAQQCPGCFSTDCFTVDGKSKIFARDLPVRGKAVSISLTVSRYICSSCDITFVPVIPELVEGSNYTKRLIAHVVVQSLKKNFSEVSRECCLSESTVREIFTTFVEQNQHLLSKDIPRVMGVDDVYVRRVPRFIMTDIEKKTVIELLPKRDIATICGHFHKMKNRDKVEVVTMDMCRTFRNSIKDYFRNAKTVIDTFHVQRMCSKAIMTFLANTRESLDLKGRRILLRDRFLLLKRPFNLTDEEKEKLNSWTSMWGELEEIYNLKEEFFAIWRLKNRAEAETKFLKWKNIMSAGAASAFREIIGTIENWYDEIFNYFDHRFTNAFTESANNLIKRLQSDGRGYDYETLRAKILFRYCLDSISEENITMNGFHKSTELSRLLRLKIARESQYKNPLL